MTTTSPSSKALILSFALFFCAASIAVGQELNDLPPGALLQLKSMSPSEQEQLARQYGIALPESETTDAVVPSLASPGGELMPPATPPVEESTAQENKKVGQSRFGRSLFDREVSTFAPTDDAPVPESYRLGVGDQLLVQLFGKENEEIKLQVGRSGDVNFPKLGAITLSGLSFEDARDLILTRVSQQLIGVEAVVSMGRLRAINIFMAGEVTVPGAYSVSALTTVTQALFQAGGVTDIGSLRQITVRRNGKTAVTFDAYDLLLMGDTSNDIRLQSGDVVFVPPYEAVVSVEGEVKRPLIYELVGGETFSDVLAMAGWFTRDAFPSTSTLRRRSDTLELPQLQTLDLSKLDQQSRSIKNGDVIAIPRAGDFATASVSIKGAVTRPGMYGWKSGMRLSELIGDARRDLRRNADLRLGMVVRQTNELLDIEVLSFAPALVIAEAGSDQDPILAEFDEILVFSLPTSLRGEPDTGEDEESRQFLLREVIAKLNDQATYDEPKQTVSISGAVRAPGTYPLLSGATVRTLINAAGGLIDSAFLERTELRRLIERPGGKISADYREIDLSTASGGSETLLVSRDHVTVREIPDWSPSDSVVVEGEVNFPGRYRIRRGETITQVIRRAGGLTDEASPESAVFTRVAIATLETERAKQFAREIQTTFATRQLTEETKVGGVGEISQIVSVLETVEGAGRLLIDLPAALSGDKALDLEVTNGDRLIIPKVSNILSVVGEVKMPSTHVYNHNLHLSDYIDLSAGFTRRADEGGVYIVKANGAVVNVKSNLWRFSADESSNLEPGDTVVVPINTRYKDSLASWSEITQIVYQSMVTLAAVIRL
jgi:polysaccharide export outer membrane protein